MEKEEFKKELEQVAGEIQVELGKEQLEQFWNYMNVLIEWNKNINLTAITEPKEILIKHFIDSLTIQKYIKETDKLIDVGTGAGFPAIPLKIVKKDSEIVLLDSLKKRLNFLEEVIQMLGLEKISLLHARAEDGANKKEYREKFDVATSRAVAPLNILMEYLLPYVKVGGICIAMKANNTEEEIENSKKAIKILGGELEKIEKLLLPGSDIQRNIIIIKKVKKTPVQYPRKAGTPSKNPLS